MIPSFHGSSSEQWKAIPVPADSLPKCHQNISETPEQKSERCRQSHPGMLCGQMSPDISSQLPDIRQCGNIFHTTFSVPGTPCGDCPHTGWPLCTVPPVPLPPEILHRTWYPASSHPHLRQEENTLYSQSFPDSSQSQ